MAILPAGSYLVPNPAQYNYTWSNVLYSNDGSHWLIIQTDGNLVLYETTKGAIWASGTNFWNGNFQGWLAMQTDGNLVLYDQNGSPFWATNTSGNWGNAGYWVPDGSFQLSPYLNMQDDGNAVLYTEFPIFASNTFGQ
jgi:pseudomonalisin